MQIQIAMFKILCVTSFQIFLSQVSLVLHQNKCWSFLPYFTFLPEFSPQFGQFLLRLFYDSYQAKAEGVISRRDA